MLLINLYCSCIDGREMHVLARNSYRTQGLEAVNKAPGVTAYIIQA